MRTNSDSYLLILPLVALLVCPPPLMAAVIVVDGTCTLVDAITAANTDTATGSCPAGSGADEIQLTVDVTLTEVDNTTDGPNGLPSITSEMTIRSSDGTPRTVERGSGAPDFRIFHGGSSGSLSLERVVVSNGDLDCCYRGGGILNRGQLALTNSTVAGNSAQGDAGGIYNWNATLSLTNSTVSGNAAYFAGGILTWGYATLTNSIVAQNYAEIAGGGILNEGQLALTNTTVSGNSAFHHGGGIDNHGDATLSNSTVSSNSASVGGGIRHNSGVSTLSLANSTVSGNSAFHGGGGIDIRYGTAILTNSSVSGNSALYTGGGIRNYGYVTLKNSTVSGNSANFWGGGIYHDATDYGEVTLTGSLVANSPSGGNCGGNTVTNFGNNLADDNTCGSIPGTLTGLDPVLADNGGPTLTHALLAGSNAIDLAGSCGLPTDQRLAPRDDGGCDSGSFEFGALPPDWIFFDGFESGDTSAWSQTVP